MSMLQYEYKSVYFVCRKPKYPLIVDTPTEVYENGFNYSADDEEEGDTKDSCSDIADHDTETN